MKSNSMNHTLSVLLRLHDIQKKVRARGKFPSDPLFEFAQYVCELPEDISKKLTHINKSYLRSYYAATKKFYLSVEARQTLQDIATDAACAQMVRAINHFAAKLGYPPMDDSLYTGDTQDFEQMRLG
ncbi:hypothetical protein LJC32_02785 [Oscillospiraceae bacterium OttesenSCG-928-F05]|nr:hypothetical protein [Oscillospiraceae bacterium OttesenSCG-928-F05]